MCCEKGSRRPPQRSMLAGWLWCRWEDFLERKSSRLVSSFMCRWLARIEWWVSSLPSFRSWRPAASPVILVDFLMEMYWIWWMNMQVSDERVAFTFQRVEKEWLGRRQREVMINNTGLCGEFGQRFSSLLTFWCRQLTVIWKKRAFFQKIIISTITLSIDRLIWAYGSWAARSAWQV